MTPVRIFIVEDHAPDVYLVQKALRENQVEFQLTRFDDGEQVLRALQKPESGALEVPDLIILDLNVPKIDGERANRNSDLVARGARQGRCHGVGGRSVHYQASGLAFVRGNRGWIH
jgi:DNA-binding NarL/FixJ family response regulator